MRLFKFVIMKLMSKVWIGVIDCNNFFVSCERLFRPDLLNKPVVVLSSNDGCVVARSQEIKDMNVPMGVPYFHIKDILKKACATTFSSNFTLYRDVSRRVFSAVRSELGWIEQYSIDEAFFTLPAMSKIEAENVVKQLKGNVEKMVGIPVSVGIARTKTQAKCASVLAKKAGGITILDEVDWEHFVPDLPIGKIWGVGGKLELKYIKHGIKTASDLINFDPIILANLFCVVGTRLQQELRGNSVFKVTKIHDSAQSITSSRSFAKTTTNKAVLADAIAYHVRQVAVDLRKQGQKTKLMRVFLKTSRHGDFILYGGTRELKLIEATSDTLILSHHASGLLDELFESGIPYKKVGVVLSMLESDSVEQQHLFETNEHENNDSLMKIIDDLNFKTGKELVMIGSRLRSNDWKASLKSKSPAYTTKWKELAVVSAN